MAVKRFEYGPTFNLNDASANRYVTSGELAIVIASGTGQGTVTSIRVGSNLVEQPTPITVTGSIALSPNLQIATLGTTGDVLVSGTELHFQPIWQGSQTSAQRYVTSGELAAAGGAGTVTSLKSGANVVLQPATITTTGTIAITPTPTFSSVWVTGDVLTSGTQLTLGTAYQGAVSAASRYVTSGEMKAGTVTSLSPGSNITLAPNPLTTTGTIALTPNIAISTAVLSSDLLVSGNTIHFAPIFQGTQASAQRYVTSGELAAAASVSGITTLNALTAQAQSFATGAAGADFNISSVSSTHTFNLPDAGLFSRGAITTAAQSISGVKTFVAPTVHQSDLQISGVTLHYQPDFQGSQTTANRYVTSGELIASVTSIKAGSNIVLQPSTITTTGTIALTPTINVTAISDTGDLLVSGTAVLFGPLYQGVATGAARYVTSGGLAVAISSLVVGSNLTAVPNPITTTGTIALSPNVSISSLVVTGDTQVSGNILVFGSEFQGSVTGGQRYVVSGELRGGTVTSIAAGSNLVASPTTITTTGTIALSPNISVSSVVDTGDLLVSGTTVHFGPVYQNVTSSAQRYVTSGELAAATSVSGITTLNGLTAQSQSFAVASTGNDFAISSVSSTHTFAIPSASTFARGLITTTAQTLSGVKTFADNIALLAALQVSGVTLSYAPHFANAQTGAQRYLTSGEITVGVTSVGVGSNLIAAPSSITTTGTIALTPNPVISSLVITGDMQLSGTLLHYGPLAGDPNILISGNPANVIGTLYQGFGVASANRYVTSGELSAGSSGTVTSLKAGSNITLDNATITTTGTIALSPNPSVTSLVTTQLTDTGDLLVSGTTIYYGPVYQGAATGANRYVTSGGLPPLVTALKAGSNIVLDPATITTTGTIALSANPSITSLAATQITDTGSLLVSGVTVHFAPVLQGAQRYIVSGELAASAPQFKSIQTTITGITGPYMIAPGFIPAGTIAIGMIGQVVLAVSGAANWVGWNLGVSGTSSGLTQWAAAMPGTLGVASTVANFGESFAGNVYTTATDAYLSASGANFGGGGSLTLTYTYTDLTGPVVIPTSSGIYSLNALTAQTQLFALGTQGSDVGIASATSTHTFNFPDASAGSRGLVTTAAQTFSGVKFFATNSILNVNVQISGGLHIYGSTKLGDGALGGFTKINSMGDVQISGATYSLSYTPFYATSPVGANRYVTSGELTAGGGAGTVTSLKAGSNITLQPATITTTGTIALTPDVIVTSVVDTGALLVSGTTVHFAPVFANATTGSNRYVTSGELPISLTKRFSMLQWGALPSASGMVWFEPASITQTNDRYPQMVARFQNTTTKNSLGVRFPVPVDYKSNAKVYVFWTSTSTTGSGVWNFDYNAAPITASLDPSTDKETLSVTSAAPGSSQTGVSSSVTLTATGVWPNDIVQGNVSRNGFSGDTLGADAIVYDVLFEYTT